jgi:ribosomal protein L11 methyltransferase
VNKSRPVRQPADFFMSEELDYIEVVFSDIDQNQREILIANLSDAGFEAFEERQENLQAYIPRKKFDQGKLDQFLGRLPIAYTSNLIKSQNWNLLWESSFQPVLVCDRVFIRADFHEALQTAAFDIIITPKMSFGTGHHETTSMMIEAILALELKNKTVLDFGTGTGILSIFAEKLGADSILAVDCDNWSISNSIENIGTNNCRKIVLQQTDRFPEGNEFDFIFANVNKSVILDSAYKFTYGLKKNGTLVLSGLLENDLEEIMDAFAPGFGNPHSILKKNNWLCLTFILERTDR